MTHDKDGYRVPDWWTNTSKADNRQCEYTLTGPIGAVLYAINTIAPVTVLKMETVPSPHLLGMRHHQATVEAAITPIQAITLKNIAALTAKVYKP